MAMLPFCGYHMGDYWQHWIDMGKKVDRLPKIFNVNWFRLDDEGNFIWPGFGDNLRVLEWILRRCEGSTDPCESCETPIGHVPRVEDLFLEGAKIEDEAVQGILAVDRELWRKEVAQIEEYYKQFGDKLPKELAAELEKLKENLR